MTLHLGPSLIAAVCLAAIAGTVATASADPFSPLADNREHSYCWGDGFTSDALKGAASDAMANLQSQTTFHSQLELAVLGRDRRPMASIL